MGSLRGRLWGVALLVGAMTSLAACAPDDSRGGSKTASPTSSEPIRSTPATAGPTAESLLERAAKVRVFFGHMSVGENILSGISALSAGEPGVGPHVTPFALDGALPVVPASGALVHTSIGQNGDPLGKLANFDRVLRAGLAEQVDVAVLKFCYIDINADTDVEALAREYRSTLAALERDYPSVTFLHSTAPLMAPPSGIRDRVKSWLGKDDNVARERYSALIREAYDPDRIFDIAAIEGTDPDGKRSPALYSGYTTDGGHLNETGSALVADAFLRLIAAQARG